MNGGHGNNTLNELEYSQYIDIDRVKVVPCISNSNSRLRPILHPLHR